MKRMFGLLAFAATAVLCISPGVIGKGTDAFPVSEIKPCAIEGGYAVVVSKETNTKPEWANVVAALKAKYDAETIVYSGSVKEARDDLAKLLPRYACFVARPEEAGRQFVIDVHRLTRKLN